ncbi:MAG TPA: PIG-L family deacetylase [Vicinamibacterales bacterium]|nr:PIG-L family deacetylase [Vicinamibacterales bacterium]
MKGLTRAILVAIVAAVLAALGPARVGDDEISAQLRVRPVDLEDGAIALGLVLRQLRTTGVFMQATAHPDDENNALHVYLNRGQGVRTILATATRGDGGQNEIGPEIFDALAVLRTEELETMHRFDRSEQYFTRAVDFGYSFSIEETFEKWGRDEILGDYVRLIRSTRPDVILGMSPAGTGGGQHHQASAILSREAFKAAADPARYSEQLKEGLRPWQPKKYYSPATTPLPPGALAVAAIDTSGFDPLLGRTYAEVGTEERGMHKSQAMGQFSDLPSGPSARRYLLVDSFVKSVAVQEASFFEGIDTSLPGLANFVAGLPPPVLVAGLREIAEHVASAQQRFAFEGPFASAQALADGLRAVRALRQRLGTMGLSEDAHYEIDVRLGRKEAEFTSAVVLAHGIRIEVLANDGVVVPSQSVRVSVIVGDRGPRDAGVGAVSFTGFSTDGACEASLLRPGSVHRCDSELGIPANARITKPYWKRLANAARYEFEPDAPFGLSSRPTPFRAKVPLTLSGVDVTLDLPVEFRYQGQNFEGEKRMAINVVPRLALRAIPPIVIVPAGRGATAAVDREVRVTVTNHGKEAVAGQVRIPPPAAGWTVTPTLLPVSFTREDESQTLRFIVRPGAKAALGEYSVKAIALAGPDTFEAGFQTVEYPHIRRSQLEIPATVAVKVMDVQLAPNLNIGYVMGTGDEVPAALRGLGASVQMLDADDLSWGDLSGYHAVVIGVRAYDSREDLRASNKRVLDYAASGGTVIVQYNRNNSWTQYAPYATRFTNTRVTDENGQVQILASDDPVFHYPNEIGEAAWRNWVQERGTYFIAPDDQRYTELIQIQEPFEYNAGWKKGALVSAQVGKGRWIYVGLGLWRQVAAGTDGAYQLLANLVSRGKLPGSR